MEDPSIILLRVASHWWSLLLFRRNGNRQYQNQSHLGNHCTFKEKCAVQFT